MKWPEGAKKVGLFDPSRPKVNERPGLLRPDGSPMHAIVPSLSIDILAPLRSGEEVTCELWAFVWYGSAAKRLVCLCSSYGIPSILEKWEICPEFFLMQYMGWEPQAKVAKEVTHFEAGKPPAGVRVLSPDDVEF